MHNQDADPAAVVRRSRRWTELSRALRQDATRCAVCGDRRAPRDLTVDHIVPLRERPDLAYEVTNLRVVCLSCHAAEDPAFGAGWRGRG